MNIYKDLPFFEKDLTGWGGEHPIFEKLILNLKSQLPIIVEVGTWKGQSAINMANILKKNDIKGKIYCIDTFLGTWDLQEKECKNGYSQVYYTFLNNVVYEKCEDYIIPCPNTSLYWYKKFQKMNLKADLIYIDVSHIYEDVYADISHYSNLLSPNGIIFGDDFTWAEGVKKAVERYCLENNKFFNVTEGRYWQIL